MTQIVRLSEWVGIVERRSVQNVECWLDSRSKKCTECFLIAFLLILGENENIMFFLLIYLAMITCGSLLIISWRMHTRIDTNLGHIAIGSLSTRVFSIFCPTSDMLTMSSDLRG